MQVTFDYDKKKKLFNIESDNTALLSYIREKFSVPNKFAKFQSRFAPKRLYAITQTGQFETGLFNDVVEAIKEYSEGVDIKYTDNATQNFCKSDYSEIKSIDNNLKLYDYQKTIVKLALEYGRGICVLGTGGGKTLTIATLIYNKYINHPSPDMFKCLLLVPDRGLVQQTYNDFNEYKVPFAFSRWSGEFELDISSNVIIASNQILQSRFDDNDWVKYVDVVIVDECHKIKGKNKIGKLINKINTNNKFGFTGTLPDEKFEEWSIKGKLGPVFFEKRGDDLRSEGYLTNAEVKILKIDYKGKPKTVFTEEEFSATARYKAELDFIYDNDYRNKVIKQIARNFNNNTLILVNHIRHGELLYNILSDIEGKEVFFVQGSVSVDDRDEIKKRMENHNNIVCIAMSSIFSTGINIKNIHMIVFGSGGKAFIRLVQSIGRGLRKHAQKEKLLIIDIADNFKYGQEHYERRISIYRKEHIPFNEVNLKES